MIKGQPMSAEIRMRIGESVRRAAEKRRAQKSPALPQGPALHPKELMDPRVDVPALVEADRVRRELLEHPTLTGRLLGDPLPGRSALDQRKPRIVVNNVEG